MVVRDEASKTTRSLVVVLLSFITARSVGSISGRQVEQSLKMAQVLHGPSLGTPEILLEISCRFPYEEWNVHLPCNDLRLGVWTLLTVVGLQVSLEE